MTQPPVDRKRLESVPPDIADQFQPGVKVKVTGTIVGGPHLNGTVNVNFIDPHGDPATTLVHWKDLEAAE